MNDKRFKVIENGLLKEYEVYKVCHNKKNGKSYLIYKFEDKLYASLINYHNGLFLLDEITNDSEWDFLDMEIDKDE